MPDPGLASLIFALAGALLLILLVWQWRRGQALARAVALAQAAPAVPPPQPNLFAQIGDAVHEAVLLCKGDVILYANPLFARLVGVDRVDLAGRQRRHPEYLSAPSESLRCPKPR